MAEYNHPSSAMEIYAQMMAQISGRLVGGGGYPAGMAGTTLTGMAADMLAPDNKGLQMLAQMYGPTIQKQLFGENLMAGYGGPGSTWNVSSRAMALDSYRLNMSMNQATRNQVDHYNQAQYEVMMRGKYATQAKFDEALPTLREGRGSDVRFGAIQLATAFQGMSGIGVGIQNSAGAFGYRYGAGDHKQAMVNSMAESQMLDLNESMTKSALEQGEEWGSLTGREIGSVLSDTVIHGPGLRRKQNIGLSAVDRARRATLAKRSGRGTDDQNELDDLNGRQEFNDEYNALDIPVFSPADNQQIVDRVKATSRKLSGLKDLLGKDVNQIIAELKDTFGQDATNLFGVNAAADAYNRMRFMAESTGYNPRDMEPVSKGISEITKTLAGSKASALTSSNVAFSLLSNTPKNVPGVDTDEMWQTVALKTVGAAESDYAHSISAGMVAAQNKGGAAGKAAFKTKVADSMAKGGMPTLAAIAGMAGISETELIWGRSSKAAEDMSAIDPFATQLTSQYNANRFWDERKSILRQTIGGHYKKDMEKMQTRELEGALTSQGVGIAEQGLINRYYTAHAQNKGFTGPAAADKAAVMYNSLDMGSATLAEAERKRAIAEKYGLAGGGLIGVLKTLGPGGAMNAPAMEVARKFMGTLDKNKADAALQELRGEYNNINALQESLSDGGQLRNYIDTGDYNTSVSGPKRKDAAKSRARYTELQRNTQMDLDELKSNSETLALNQRAVDRSEKKLDIVAVGGLTNAENDKLTQAGFDWSEVTGEAVDDKRERMKRNKANRDRLEYESEQLGDARDTRSALNRYGTALNLYKGDHQRAMLTLSKSDYEKVEDSMKELEAKSSNIFTRPEETSDRAAGRYIDAMLKTHPGMPANDEKYFKDVRKNMRAGKSFKEAVRELTLIGDRDTIVEEFAHRNKYLAKGKGSKGVWAEEQDRIMFDQGGMTREAKVALAAERSEWDDTITELKSDTSLTPVDLATVEAMDRLMSENREGGDTTFDVMTKLNRNNNNALVVERFSSLFTAERRAKTQTRNLTEVKRNTVSLASENTAETSLDDMVARGGLDASIGERLSSSDASYKTAFNQLSPDDGAKVVAADKKVQRLKAIEAEKSQVSFTKIKDSIALSHVTGNKNNLASLVTEMETAYVQKNKNISNQEFFSRQSGPMKALIRLSGQGSLLNDAPAVKKGMWAEAADDYEAENKAGGLPPAVVKAIAAERASVEADLNSSSSRSQPYDKQVLSAYKTLLNNEKKTTEDLATFHTRIQSKKDTTDTGVIKEAQRVSRATGNGASLLDKTGNLPEVAAYKKNALAAVDDLLKDPTSPHSDDVLLTEIKNNINAGMSMETAVEKLGAPADKKAAIHSKIRKRDNTLTEAATGTASANSDIRAKYVTEAITAAQQNNQDSKGSKFFKDDKNAYIEALNDPVKYASGGKHADETYRVYGGSNGRTVVHRKKSEIQKDIADKVRDQVSKEGYVRAGLGNDGVIDPTTLTEETRLKYDDAIMKDIMNREGDAPSQAGGLTREEIELTKGKGGKAVFEEDPLKDDAADNNKIRKKVDAETTNEGKAKVLLDELAKGDTKLSWKDKLSVDEKKKVEKGLAAVDSDLRRGSTGMGQRAAKEKEKDKLEQKLKADASGKNVLKTALDEVATGSKMTMLGVAKKILSKMESVITSDGKVKATFS